MPNLAGGGRQSATDVPGRHGRVTDSEAPETGHRTRFRVKTSPSSERSHPRGRRPRRRVWRLAQACLAIQNVDERLFRSEHAVDLVDELASAETPEAATAVHGTVH